MTNRRIGLGLLSYYPTYEFLVMDHATCYMPKREKVERATIALVPVDAIFYKNDVLSFDEVENATKYVIHRQNGEKITIKTSKCKISLIKGEKIYVETYFQEFSAGFTAYIVE